MSTPDDQEIMGDKLEPRGAAASTLVHQLPASSVYMTKRLSVRLLEDLKSAVTSFSDVGKKNVKITRGRTRTCPKLLPLIQQTSLAW